MVLHFSQQHEKLHYPDTLEPSNQANASITSAASVEKSTTAGSKRKRAETRVPKLSEKRAKTEPTDDSGKEVDECIDVGVKNEETEASR